MNISAALSLSLYSELVALSLFPARSTLRCLHGQDDAQGLSYTRGCWCSQIQVDSSPLTLAPKCSRSFGARVDVQMRAARLGAQRGE